MLRIVRRVLLLPAPRIMREEALSAAKDFYRERGISVHEAVVMERLRHWEVLARGDIKGSPWALIDNQTGAITKSGIPPR